MQKQLDLHIENIKSAFVNGKFDKSKIKDMLSYQVSLTFVDNALNKDLITEESFKKAIEEEF
jgi:hypothetical protein